MLRRLVPVVIGLAILGTVVGIAALMVVMLGQDWEDALLWLLAAVMIGSALLVVTMRDIIRCGLAMIVCFFALGFIYALLGAPLIGLTQVIVYIGAISVLILFAIMLTQTKDAPRVLVFQTQSAAAAVASILIAIVIGLTVSATEWSELPGRVRLATAELSRILFTEARNVLPFEVIGVLLLAAVIGGVFLAKREEGDPT